MAKPINWNEFNLESDGGDVATLVYEETEPAANGGYSSMFEAGSLPMTAADAATKRLGDPNQSRGHANVSSGWCPHRASITLKQSRRKGSISATWRITSRGHRQQP